MQAMPQLTREAFLAATVAELVDYWLVPYCPSPDCPTTKLPCKLLARTHGHSTVVSVVSRLRCRQCGSRPARVLVTDLPAQVPPHGHQPHTWTVEIFP